MASYRVLEPAKNGKPRIKITVELGYDEEKGTRIRKYKNVTLNSLSDRAIKKAITEFEIEVANTEIENDLENITFEQFVQRWMDVYVRVDLAVKSRNNYESCLQGGILKYFNKMKLLKIKTFHIVNFFKEEKEQGKRNLNGKYMVLKSIFSKAIGWGVIQENPMKGVKRPYVEKRHREIQFYSENQLKQLLSILDQVYPKHRLQIKLAVFGGLRMTEIAGIRLECLDYTNNSILIDKTLQYDKETKRFFLGYTKTKKSRNVFIPDSLMQEIKEYEKELKKLKLKSGELWTPMLDNENIPINLIFVKSNGFPSYPDSMSNRWKEIVERFNLPRLTFHGLRHTFASYMISKNVNFKIIQEQLGHVDIKQTLNTYSHLTERDKIKASDLFDEIL
ncbi:tyrosine-type recombinase/integrase [Lysinibacillus xylanilyticus]|uniref:tyrosine-type recombinase/integrase n=1 Tax=Lysinibacillus xylanilyticus TaxID=582475 RepID=UPI003823DCC4